MDRSNDFDGSGHRMLLQQDHSGLSADGNVPQRDLPDRAAFDSSPDIFATPLVCTNESSRDGRAKCSIGAVVRDPLKKAGDPITHSAGFYWTGSSPFAGAVGT